MQTEPSAPEILSGRDEPIQSVDRPLSLSARLLPFARHRSPADRFVLPDRNQACRRLVQHRRLFAWVPCPSLLALSSVGQEKADCSDAGATDLGRPASGRLRTDLPDPRRLWRRPVYVAPVVCHPADGTGLDVLRRADACARFIFPDPCSSAGDSISGDHLQSDHLSASAIGLATGQHDSAAPWTFRFFRKAMLFSFR